MMREKERQKDREGQRMEIERQRDKGGKRETQRQRDR